MFWNDTFMNKIRQEWLRRISKIQYYAGNNWYDAVITDKSISGNTLKITSVTNDNLALNITAVRIIDTSGDVAGQLTENITKTATQGVITLWEFPIYEVE
jgi:hypothetical protein